jgi:arabinose-5-phosphate isomerase
MSDMNAPSMKAVPDTADPADSEENRDLAAGRRVLQLESRALARLAEELNADFALAVDKLAGVAGRIVVSGMGKSGHIGNKIAATLASTGAPAIFVHPAEASHGDLGMITRDDALLVLSNSGETTELSDLVHFSRRYEIPLIAIVGRAGSTLAQSADVALIMADEPEAGTLGLAPTTSTTMALALGDALAVALFERKQFSESDFHVFHPGGKLGQSLVRVRDIMHGKADLPLVGPDTVMAEALIVMTAKRFGCVGVVDAAGELLGIVTDGDLRRQMADNLLERKAGELMTPEPKTIREDALAGEAVREMNARQITGLFVTEGARPVGILHIHDCLRAGIT